MRRSDASPSVCRAADSWISRGAADVSAWWPNLIGSAPVPQLLRGTLRLVRTQCYLRNPGWRESQPKGFWRNTLKSPNRREISRQTQKRVVSFRWRWRRSTLRVWPVRSHRPCSLLASRIFYRWHTLGSTEIRIEVERGRGTLIPPGRGQSLR